MLRGTMPKIPPKKVGCVRPIVTLNWVPTAGSAKSTVVSLTPGS